MYTFTVPDIHGRSDLLLTAIAGIEDQAARLDGDYRIIFTGDYIDRGPDSAGVVRTLRRGQSAGKPWICLKGNHDDMMARSILYGETDMRSNWLNNGGLATLASYGEDDAQIQQDAEWMDRLPLLIEEDHRAYVHAMLHDRLIPGDARSMDQMIWGRYPDGSDVGYRNKHVVHGHTIVRDGPLLLKNRTNLDMGAYASSKLCTALFDERVPGGPTAVTVYQAELTPVWNTKP